MDLKNKVQNSDRKFGSAAFYFHCEVIEGDLTYNALFTEHEVRTAIKRAAHNPEDVPKTNKFITWIRRLFGRAQ